MVKEANYKAIVAWYEKALQPLGYVKQMDFGSSAGFGEEGGNADWWIFPGKENAGSHHAFVAKGKLGRWASTVWFDAC